MDEFEINYENNLSLCFNSVKTIVENDEPSRFLFQHSGNILLQDEYGNDQETIGSFSTIVVDAQSAAIEGVALFDVFDSDSTTLGYFENLYEYPDGYFKSEVSNIAYGDNDPCNPNLLILDRLTLKLEHRGHGVGLLVINKLIHQLRVGTGLIAMKPFPLQFESEHLHHPEKRIQLGLDQFQLPQAEATAKLQEYYGLLGFKLFPGSDYMVRPTELGLNT